MNKKQNTVYASCHSNNSGNPEFHKFNTQKDAEERLQEAKDCASNPDEFVGVVVAYLISGAVVPQPGAKGKKQAYVPFEL